MVWLFAAVVALAVGSCNAERVVLFQDGGAVTQCTQAFEAPLGAPCRLTESCERRSPTSPECCTEFAACADGGLVRSRACQAGCGRSCTADSECGFAMICEERCGTCPDTSACPACPRDWQPLDRNGCPTCDCGPPRDCSLGIRCDADGEVGRCYQGQACARGCDPDDLACCNLVCALPGCPEPAPSGCVTACAQCRGQPCTLDDCVCESGRWVCLELCQEPSAASLPCR